jgi:hypothetical protein
LPADSKFIARLDLAIEILLPWGQPLKPLLSALKEILTPLFAAMDLANSYVLQGYHRVF